jgi:hypothetical protein
MLFSSCGTRRNRASGRVQAAAGDVKAHHVGEGNEANDLVHLEGHGLVLLQLDHHARDLRGALWIHRLAHARGGHPCLISKWSVNARGVHLNEGVELIAQKILVFCRGHAFQQLEEQQPMLGGRGKHVVAVSLQRRGLHVLDRVDVLTHLWEFCTWACICKRIAYRLHGHGAWDMGMHQAQPCS